MRSTYARCVWEIIHPFFVLELKSTMALPSPTGPGEKPKWPVTNVELQISDGILKAIFHHHLHQQNSLQLQRRHPNNLLNKKLPQLTADSTIVCSSSCNAWPTFKQFASNFEYETATSSLPQCSRRSRMDRATTLSKARILCVGQLVESRHLSSVEQSRSIGFTHATCDYNAVTNKSKLRDYTSVASPRHDASLNRSELPEHCGTSGLAQNTLRSWSNTVQDQIMGAAAQVHHQLMEMVSTIQQQQSPHPWAHEWADQTVQPPPAPLRPVQRTAQPQPQRLFNFKVNQHLLPRYVVHL